VFSYKI